MTSIGTPSVALGARPDALFKMLAFPGIGRSVLALPSPLPVYRRTLARSLGRPALDASPPELIRATYLGTRRPGLAATVSTYLREQFRGVRATPQRYVLQDSEHAGGSVLHERLSVFWGTPSTLAGQVRGGRFPPLDRLDLLEHGRLLTGRDARQRVARPGQAELLAAGAEFALGFLAGAEAVADRGQDSAQGPCTTTMPWMRSVRRRGWSPVGRGD